MRTRAGVVISDGTSILLMYRHKQGREYFIIPGGGVEPGETLRQAAIREAHEETSLVVELGRELSVCETNDQIEHYFEVTSYSGKPQLGGEELAKSSDANRYSLEWLGKAELKNIVLQPREMLPVLISTLS